MTLIRASADAVRRSSIVRRMVLAASFGLVAGAANAQPACPESLDVVSEVRSAPPGWESLGPKEARSERHRLRHVTFTDGHPRARAFLRPTSSRSSASGERTDVYKFSPASQEGIFLVCQYVETRQSVFRPITATACEVTENDRLDKPVQRVSCR